MSINLTYSFHQISRLRLKQTPGSLLVSCLLVSRLLVSRSLVAVSLLTACTLASLNCSSASAADRSTDNKTLARAVQAMRQHNYANAVKYADTYLEFQPNVANAQYIKARALFLSQKKSESLAAYKKLLTMRPTALESSAALMDMAAIEYDAKNFALSIQYLDKAIAIKPSAYGYSLKAQVFRTQKLETQAEACLKKALILSPSSPWIYHELTVCLIAQGKYTDALKRSEKLVELKKSDPETYNLRAQIYEGLHQTSAARVEQEKAKKLTDNLLF
jgi:tetratricopeptide (TPR) repeat protein